MNRLVTLVKNDTGPDLTVVIVRNENNDRFVTDASNVFLNIRRKDTPGNIVSISADGFKSSDTQGQYVFNLKSFLIHADVNDDFYEGEIEFVVPSGVDENNNQITDTYTTFEQITIQVRDDYT
jgi:hypothetical protein